MSRQVRHIHVSDNEWIVVHCTCQSGVIRGAVALLRVSFLPHCLADVNADLGWLRTFSSCFAGKCSRMSLIIIGGQWEKRKTWTRTRRTRRAERTATTAARRCTGNPKPMPEGMSSAAGTAARHGNAPRRERRKPCVVPSRRVASTPKTPASPWKTPGVTRRPAVSGKRRSGAIHATRPSHGASPARPVRSPYFQSLPA